MSAAHDVELLLAQLGPSHRLRVATVGNAPNVALTPLGSLLPLGWQGLDDVLPDGGLPRGVVELTAPRALGGATRLALAAVRGGQRRAQGAWCAWLDPEGTLYAPGVVAAGVDLSRMLVVRPPRVELGRVAVKVVGSAAFEVVIVDVDAVPRASEAETPKPKRKMAWAPDVLVRKLALAADAAGTTVVLLTDSTRPRAIPWPVALRLELARPSRFELAVRVAKDKRGRIGLAKTIPFGLGT